MISATQRTNHPGVEETRAKILDAARRLFERLGTRGTTTREVAELAGVNEATVFRHFGSKRALLAAMREQACDLGALRATLASLRGSDLREDLRALAYHVAEHIAGKRAMLCVSLAEDAAVAGDSPEWRGPSQILADLAGYFARGVERGVVRGEPQLLARSFLGLLFSYVIARKLWESHTLDRATLDAIVDLFLNGVIA